MAITRSRSFLTAACVAMAATTMVIVATVTTGTSPTDSAWFWAGAIMAFGTTLTTIEPARDRFSRAADWLLGVFMSFARRRSDLEHKLQAQRHDAIARRATAHRQDRPTTTARWRMCPSI